MMKCPDNRVFCELIANLISDEVVNIIQNNYRRRVK